MEEGNGKEVNDDVDDSENEDKNTEDSVLIKPGFSLL